MSIPFDPGMDPESLRDAPLFRELQRVMAAGSGGPVNWELARQVGVATAAETGAEREPSADGEPAWTEAVRLAELRVADATGIDPPSEVAKVRLVSRTGWVADATASLKGVIETAAATMTEALRDALGEQLPPEAAPMAEMLTQLGPLVQGSQVGQVLGAEAGSAFGGSHLSIPRTDGASIVFVPANVERVAQEWSLDDDEFRTSIAVHEVAHRASLARSWTRPYLASLLEDFLATLTIDIDAIAERLRSLGPGDESLQEALGGDGEGLFGAVLDDEQRLKLARIEAFVGAADGWAGHVTEVVGRALPGSADRITEALRRRRDGQDTEPVFTRLLAIPIARDAFAAGRRFCDVVAEQADEATLARMWDGAEALPSRPELDEPTLWLSRTV